jgi:hypothetical protein
VLRAVRGEIRGLTNSRRSRLELRNSQTIDRMADHKITPIETPREGGERERERESKRQRERGRESKREREREGERLEGQRKYVAYDGTWLQHRNSDETMECMAGNVPSSSWIK